MCLPLVLDEVSDVICIYMQNILKLTDCYRSLLLYERPVQAGTKKDTEHSVQKTISIISQLKIKVVSTCLAHWSFSKTI